MKLRISRPKSFRFAPLGLALAIFAGPVWAQEKKPEPLRYTVTDLGPVGGPPGQPFVIKNNSLISEGVAVSDTAWHAMLWFHGVQIDLAKAGGLGGPSSVAFGVNQRRQAVGEAETANLDPNGEDFCGFGTRLICQPFIWQNGVMSPLAPLKNADGVTGTNAIANGINILGQIAGTAENADPDSTCPPYDPASLQYQQFKFKPACGRTARSGNCPHTEEIRTESLLTSTTAARLSAERARARASRSMATSPICTAFTPHYGKTAQ